MSNVQIDYDVHLDFEALLTHSRQELLRDLVSTAQTLSDLSQRIGFLRAEEVRQPKESFIKAERVEAEALRSAYEEKKWVIIRLFDLGVNGGSGGGD